MRECRLCGETKPLTEYHLSTKGVNGRDSRCKTCKNALKRLSDSSPDGKRKNSEYVRSERYKRMAKTRRMTPDRMFKIVQKHLDKREDKLIAGTKYVSRDEALELGLPRYFEGLICKRGHRSERLTSNLSCCECVLEASRTRERKIKKSERYYADRDRRMRQNVTAQRLRYAKDPGYKASIAARNMLKRVLYKGNSKKIGGTYEMLGYDRDQLMTHMESLFSEGMTWSNYGEWHIDHIKPVSLFIKEGETRPSVINALSNLQPLWAKDNFDKRDMFDE